MNTISNGMSKGRRRWAVRGVLVMVVIGVAVAYVFRTGSSFESSYVAYKEAKTDYITATYKPAVESNPVRRQINILLSEVLERPMGPQERIEIAQRGLAHLEDIESQIDQIKEAGDDVMPLIESLEQDASSLGSFARRDLMKSVASLARREAEIIADIRGLSYRANYHTGEVFERIIDERGELTPAHVQDLNNLIPQLEEQFDQRSNLYEELERIEGEIDAYARELGIDT